MKSSHVCCLMHQSQAPSFRSSWWKLRRPSTDQRLLAQAGSPAKVAERGDQSKGGVNNTMYVCMDGWMHECMDVCMYVRTYIRMYVWLSACLPGCLSGFHACMHPWTHVCMYMHVSVYAFMHVCMHAWMHAYGCTQITILSCLNPLKYLKITTSVGSIHLSHVINGPPLGTYPTIPSTLSSLRPPDPVGNGGAREKGRQ